MTVVVVRSLNGDDILGPVEMESGSFGLRALKLQMRSLPFWSEGDLSLMNAEGEVLTADSRHLSGGSWTHPLVLAAIRTERSFYGVPWGAICERPESSSALQQLMSGGLMSVVASEKAVAAVTKKGAVVFCPGELDGLYEESDGEEARDDDDDLIQHTWEQQKAELSEGVNAIYANMAAFAAIKEGGKVVCWGRRHSGGWIPKEKAEKLCSGVKTIAHTSEAFAALKETGEVVTWGKASFGGNCESVADKLVDVVSITGTWGTSDSGAFAALTKSGACIVWGNHDSGGNSRDVAEDLQHGVLSISSAGNAFAALKDGGRVVTWGRADSGGEMIVTWGPDSEDDEEASDDGQEEDESEEKGETYSVQDQLSSGVISVVGSDNVFVALKDTGEVVAWGCAPDGAHLPDELRSRLNNMNAPVRSIGTGSCTFAALKEDGSVVLWGVLDDFGCGTMEKANAEVEVTSDVVSVSHLCKPNMWGMFAFKKDGAAIPIGFVGNVPPHVLDELKSGVVDIVAGGGSYLALKYTL